MEIPLAAFASRKANLPDLSNKFGELAKEPVLQCARLTLHFSSYRGYGIVSPLPVGGGPKTRRMPDAGDEFAAAFGLAYRALRAKAEGFAIWRRHAVL